MGQFLLMFRRILTEREPRHGSGAFWTCAESGMFPTDGEHAWTLLDVKVSGKRAGVLNKTALQVVSTAHGW